MQAKKKTEMRADRVSSGKQTEKQRRAGRKGCTLPSFVAAMGCIHKKGIFANISDKASFDVFCLLLSCLSRREVRKGRAKVSDQRFSMFCCVFVYFEVSCPSVMIFFFSPPLQLLLSLLSMSIIILFSLLSMSIIILVMLMPTL
jgi:hypothetical protein